MNKQLITTNLQTLLAAVEAFPEAQFNLSAYRQESPECGTLFCVAGLAATLPHFNEQGMYLSYSEVWDDWTVRMRGGVTTVGDDESTEELFGQEAWYNLFATYGSGNRDLKLGAYAADRWTRTLSHKELAIKRIQAQIEAVEAV